MQHLKMWTTLSASRWICLLTLTVVMLVSASQVDSSSPIIRLPCCLNVSSRKIERVKTCYEQKPREGCQRHAFLVVTRKNKQWCINPDAAWLKDKIEKGKLSCPPDLTPLSGVNVA
ncbi:C-C motif chemokine 5-like [Sparus aurata]|uniref:C-C motif chemokine 5-like n=1 Tax=Sparus aurata TaxID=8175 RepID=UPI0011C17446|nr:C-C motif chemokine 5-like [Sparus aurata]